MKTKSESGTKKIDSQATGNLPIWTFYQVAWHFITKLCASVPADPEIVAKWLEARQPRVKPAGALSIQEINEEVLASIERGDGEPDQEYSMLVFQRHQQALMMRAGTIRAHIKDCARVLSAQYIGRIENERAFSTRVVNGVYVDESFRHVGIRGTMFVPILRADGSPVIKADGAYDKPIHTRGPRGVQNALKRFEYIEPPSKLEFRLKVLGRSISEADLNHLFDYGGTHGYAGERSDGEGKYTYEITRL